MNNYLSDNGCIQWVKVLSNLLLFLILPPFIGLPLIVYSIWSGRNNTHTQYFVFFFCIAAYFAAINATKIPGGDQIQYYFAYKNVPEQGFIGSLINIYGITYSWQEERTHISPEFMNGVYNYVGYYLTFGYYPLFAALLTFANYVLIFLGLHKFCQTLKKPHIPIVCGVLILSFFYLFFNYTMLVQKQFLAQSIVMYVIGSYALSGKMTKKLWVMTACAVFTHASMTFFVPFLLLQPLRSRLTKKGLLFMGINSFLLVVFGPQLAGNIISSDDNTTALTYGVSRLATLEDSNDGLTLQWNQVWVIGLPLAIITIKKLWGERKTLNVADAFILNIMLLLIIAVIAMYRQPLAQYRYFMMFIAFMPFVYPFISNNIHMRDRFLKCLSGIMIIWFYYQFENIIWTYAPEWQIVTYPPAVLIFMGF